MKDWIPILAVLLLSYPLFLLLRMIFIAPYQLYKKLMAENARIQSELDILSRKEKESVLGVFDFSARDAAEYVMKELAKDVPQATEFLTQMAIEGRVHIRAIEFGHSTDSPVAPEIFQEHKLHLIGNENQRQQAEFFGCAFDDDGWIAERFTATLVGRSLYRAPRFLFKEIAEVVKWYKASRPR